jgi:hypothetical protein
VGIARLGPSDAHELDLAGIIQARGNAWEQLVKPPATWAVEKLKWEISAASYTMVVAMAGKGRPYFEEHVNQFPTTRGLQVTVEGEGAPIVGRHVELVTSESADLQNFKNSVIAREVHRLATREIESKAPTLRGILEQSWPGTGNKDNYVKKCMVRAEKAARLDFIKEAHTPDWWSQDKITSSYEFVKEPLGEWGALEYSEQEWRKLVSAPLHRSIMHWADDESIDRVKNLFRPNDIFVKEVANIVGAIVGERDLECVSVVALRSCYTTFVLPPGLNYEPVEEHFPGVSAVWVVVFYPEGYRRVAPGGALLFNGFRCHESLPGGDCLYMAFVVNEEREAWVKGNERRLRAVKKRSREVEKREGERRGLG